MYRLISMLILVGLLASCSFSNEVHNPEIACTFRLETVNSVVDARTITVPSDTDTSIIKQDWNDFHIELTYVRFQPKNKKDAQFFISFRDLKTDQQIVGNSYVSPTPFSNVFDDSKKNFTGNIFISDPNVTGRKIVYWCFTLP